MMDVASSEVKAAYADPARVILPVNSHFHIKKEGKARMLVTTRPGLILTRSRNSMLPLPKMAAIDRSHTSAHAVHLLHACC